MSQPLRTRIARMICDASWTRGRGLTIGQAEAVAADIVALIDGHIQQEHPPLLVELESK